MTLTELHEYTAELLANRPELAHLRLVTPTEDGYAHSLGLPVEGNLEGSHVRWTADDSENAQADYEKAIREAGEEGFTAPANVIVM